MLFSLRRLFVVDINAQRLVVSNDEGLYRESIDLGGTYGRYSIQWPSSIQVTLIQADLVNSTSLQYRLQAYVTEYLGRVWQIQLLGTITNSSLATFK